MIRNESISLWFRIHIFRDNKEDIVAHKYEDKNDIVHCETKWK